LRLRSRTGAGLILFERRREPAAPLMSQVWAVLALVTLFGMAMANALLWQTRTWQLQGPGRPEPAVS
jgi:hypothetical protein